MNEAKNEESQPNASDESANYGYNLFPERKGELSRTVTGILTGKEGKEEIQRMKCERTVYKCFMTSSLVKLMTGALKASGCDIDLRRHVVCEVCHSRVSGGYDPETNQIVICQNNSRSEGVVQGIMTHEMIHMFDYCNNKVDFKNLDHLACTEIRAANLTHCSLTSSVLQGDVSPFNIKANHKECVKRKALASIMAVRNVSLEEAVAAVERVFPKCYNDLEPIGRRIKGGGDDQKRAYAEGFLYGYV
nr:mitochondrial inner membrane protease ATP23 homolog [Halyomorpha halys]